MSIGNATHWERADIFWLRKFDRKLNIKIFCYSILSLAINVEGGCNYKGALNQAKIGFPYWTKENPNKLPRHLSIWLPQLVLLFWNYKAQYFLRLVLSSSVLSHFKMLKKCNAQWLYCWQPTASVSVHETCPKYFLVHHSFPKGNLALYTERRKSKFRTWFHSDLHFVSMFFPQ